jgi:hypothetical protein
MDADFLNELAEACEPIFVRQLEWTVTKATKTKPKSPKPSKHGYTPDFEEWFSHYLHKVGKLDAFKAWPRAKMQVMVEQEFGDEEEAIAFLTDAIKEYARSDKARECPYNPATFLNGRHWDDDRSAWNRPAESEKPKKLPAKLNFGDLDE